MFQFLDIPEFADLLCSIEKHFQTTKPKPTGEQCSGSESSKSKSKTKSNTNESCSNESHSIDFKQSNTRHSTHSIRRHRIINTIFCFQFLLNKKKGKTSTMELFDIASMKTEPCYKNKTLYTFTCELIKQRILFSFDM